MANKRLTPEIESVLRAAKIEGNKLFLVGQLDPKPYKQVKEFLLNVGAEWSRKEGCHIFKSDPTKLLFAMEEGVAVDERKERQAFYTPQRLVEEVVEWADVKDKTVLEPSCGDGRFIREFLNQGAVKVDAVELDEVQAKAIMPEFFGIIAIHVGDFLKFDPSQDDSFDPQYDIICGNPPYNKNNFYHHTVHAYKFVKDGGKLVFILPNSIHTHKKFQEFVSDKRWEFKPVPEKTFSESGTNIATNIVIIWK